MQDTHIIALFLSFPHYISSGFPQAKIEKFKAKIQALYDSLTLSVNS